MAITPASFAAKQRILSACVRLFLEKGYKRTTVAEILKAANVSASTFQNIFHAKDGVLIEFVQFMFGNQFNIARKVTGHELPPVYVYALETSLQLTLTELNESLREVYLEAYRQPQSADYIYRHTASELYQIFGSYLPPRIPSATFTSRTSVRAASCARIWSVRAICILRWKRSSRAF